MFHDTRLIITFLIVIRKDYTSLYQSYIYKYRDKLIFTDILYDTLYIYICIYLYIILFLLLFIGSETYFRCIMSNEDLMDFKTAIRIVSKDHNIDNLHRNR